MVLGPHQFAGKQSQEIPKIEIRVKIKCLNSNAHQYETEGKSVQLRQFALEY